MGKTYHRNKPADVDRSHAFKPAKTKVRLNPRDVYTALDEEFDYWDTIQDIAPMMESRNADPFAWEPPSGGMVLPHSKGQGRSVIA